MLLGDEIQANRAEHRRRFRSRAGTPPVTTRTIVVPERLRHERGQSSVPACRPLGGNIRVGLEDSLWMSPRKLAKSNAEQVARARQIAGKAAVV
jgi:beta-keto acid cleavage enzyme